MDFEVFGLGPLCASVCTSLTPEEAELALNVECPTEVRTRWTLSEDKTFAGGEPMPCECPDNPGNKHYLFNC